MHILIKEANKNITNTLRDVVKKVQIIVSTLIFAKVVKVPFIHYYYTESLLTFMSNIFTSYT